MKSVLISIQPKWCGLIASGKKTVEVRKTKPKLKTPFKVYIYCTNNKDMLWILKESERESRRKIASIFTAKDVGGATKANGKVIGEFVCDEIKDCREVFIAPTCLTTDEWLKYTDGYKRKVWGWHISDLVIYDKPRELGEFSRKCEKTPCEGCEHLKYQGVNSAEYDYDCEFLGNRIPITRPPQSWCYVESEDKKRKSE